MRLDEFLRGDLTGDRLPTTWLSSHQLVYQADDGGLLALDTFNNTLIVLVTNHTLVRYYENVATLNSLKMSCMYLFRISISIHLVYIFYSK